MAKNSFLQLILHFDPFDEGVEILSPSGLTGRGEVLVPLHLNFPILALYNSREMPIVEYCQPKEVEIVE